MGVDDDRDKGECGDMDADLGAGTDAGVATEGDLASVPQEACRLDRAGEGLLRESDRESRPELPHFADGCSPFDSPANLPLIPFSLAGTHGPHSPFST